jgi:hypothetical protein
VKISVVAPAPRPGWDEKGLVVQRFAGALACHADVELLMPAEHDRTDRHGALTVRRFRSTPAAPGRQAALRELIFGPDARRHPPRCQCSSEMLRDAAISLPMEVQVEFVESAGGRSPGLLEHLAEQGGEAVVFCDYSAPATRDGMLVLPDATPAILLPLAAAEPALSLDVHDTVFERANAVVTVTGGERDRLLRRRTPPASPLHDLRFVLRVHDLVWKNEPLAYDADVPTVVIPREWRPGSRTDALVRLARTLEHRFGGRLQVRLVGPGWKHVPGDLRGPYADSRFDIWRWCCRALAVVDPDSGKLLGREVLESMMYGTPVVVPFEPGAAVEHAQASSGGLWYRTDDELEACLGSLLDHEVRGALGAQAKQYADGNYQDTESYVRRAGELLDEFVGVS